MSPVEKQRKMFSSYHERDLVELLPKEYILNDKFNRKKGFYQYCMMQCYIKLYVTFKRGHQEGNFKCIDIFNLTSRRLKKNTNLRQPRLRKKPVMVYRGRGRVGGFFSHGFQGGGMEGDQSLQTEYTREQMKIDGELIIILQSLGVEGGGNKIL